jgi:hypothetical protein
MTPGRRCIGGEVSRLKVRKEIALTERDDSGV